MMGDSAGMGGVTQNLGFIGAVICTVGLATACGGGAAVHDASPMLPSFTTGDYPYSVAIGDFNADGNPDLAVANLNSDTVSVLLNTTAMGATVPTFAPKVDLDQVLGPWSVAIGDLNADGKPDLAVADGGSSSASVLLNTTAAHAASPSFAANVQFTTGIQRDPRSVAIGDVNGDGVPDLAVADYAGGAVSVFLSTTAMGATVPTFATNVDFATGTAPRSVAIGDFNGDGKPDLAVANFNNSPDTASVFLNTTATGAMTPSFAAKFDLTAGQRPISVAVGDLNGDGKPDLVVANQNTRSVSVFLNTTMLGATTPSFSAKADFTTDDGCAFVAVSDIDGDGKPDLAVATISDKISVLLNTTPAGAMTPTFAPRVDYMTGACPQSIAIGDLNRDGKPDFAVANQCDDTVSVILAK